MSEMRQVRVKDILPNPFRDMENYPVDEGKITALTESIGRTGWWGNTVARQTGKNTFELAYEGDEIKVDLST